MRTRNHIALLAGLSLLVGMSGTAGALFVDATVAFAGGHNAFGSTDMSATSDHGADSLGHYYHDSLSPVKSYEVDGPFILGHTEMAMHRNIAQDDCVVLDAATEEIVQQEPLDRVEDSDSLCHH